MLLPMWQLRELFDCAIWRFTTLHDFGNRISLSNSNGFKKHLGERDKKKMKKGRDKKFFKMLKGGIDARVTS